MDIFIRLSYWQRWRLRKFFAAIKNVNRTGGSSGESAAVGAQIWKDGMHVKLFDGEKGSSLANALGGKFGVTHSSMSSKRKQGKLP